MEIKQLEYFVTTVDCGSLNKAAQRLYTTQPNVTRAINSLEQELKVNLFVRSNKGISVTPHGELLYQQAVTILKHAGIISNIGRKKDCGVFGVSGYRSALLAKIMVDLYKSCGDSSLRYEFREGTIESITDDVANRTSEIGICYIPEAQKHCFKHIIGHKKLSYTHLANRGICVYVGKNHPLYEAETIDFHQLKELKFVDEPGDFFAMEHHIEKVSMGAALLEHGSNVFYTNSDYMINSLLCYLDVCCTGIDLVSTEYEEHGIRALRVNNCSPFLSIGYVSQENSRLSEHAEKYIDLLQDRIDSTCIDTDEEAV